MPQIIPALSDVSGNYRAVFCDLWGCLHNGRAPYPAAVAALQAFKAQGGTVLLLTNAPRPKPSVIKQLNRIGVPADCYDEVVSSGDAAQFALITGTVGRRVYHLGPEKDLPFFTDFADDLKETVSNQSPIIRVALEDATGIVCTGPFDDEKDVPEDYRATLLYAKTKGLKLLCANPDIVVDLGDKRLYCAGAIAQLYDQMGGESLYFGKPHPPIYDLARRRLAMLQEDINDSEILCIGDGILTDIKGAQSEGLDSVFITGGIAADQFGPDSSNPNKGLISAWLDAQQINPTYSLGSLH
ncbi:MAG: TIGR01459 family HAD-type hydrolase [Paracoccaceae bacterium]|nr:TIGR01459 family HAD-type hydrolase [Paracoccaceae bacterium]